MLVTRLALKNWRNFRSLEIRLRETTYILGPNAAGKSNLLDAFRFLRDIAKTEGGGLQAAVADRGGISSLRCLHARRDTEVLVEVDLAETSDMPPTWRYVVGFKSEGKGAQRIFVSRENVWKGNEELLRRPNKQDDADHDQLTQTYLEQIRANKSFRELSEFFNKVRYQHLVPQLVRFADMIGGQRLKEDPFGQGFLDQLALTPTGTRESRLKRIEKALKLAVPQFEELKFEKDDLGHPHLRARYKHHRPNAGWQSEEHFSDGTLRLLGLLWALISGDSILLLEEPELSLNDAIVRQIPLMLRTAQAGRKVRRQVVLSTHSEALLSNEGIDGRGIVLLEPSSEGSTARMPNSTELTALKSGLSPAEVLLPKTRPE
jgi:predicted ATPase